MPAEKLEEKPLEKSAEPAAEISLESFDTALAELEAIVEQMEGGKLNLAESLKAFERGIRLTRQCQQALSQAQQRVQMLIAEENSPRLVDFNFDRAEQGTGEGVDLDDV